MHSEWKKRDSRSGLGELWPSLLLLLLIAVVTAFVALYDIPRGKPQAHRSLVEHLMSRATADFGPASSDFVNNMTYDRSPPDVHIEVNIPATELVLFENGKPLYRRSIAIGRGIYPTPEQEAQLKRIEWNPWWYPPPAEWAKNDRPTPPGPRNPLGLVKLPLTDAILFHGTNKPWTVGRAASHGCMRMYNSDVTGIAWYIQNHFSDQNDPGLKERYLKERRRTFKVRLKKPVPVKLVYKPVVASDGSLVFYRDHYNKIAGRRKVAIISELIEGGIELKELDDDKIDELVERWPAHGSKVPIQDLLREGPSPDLLSAPECS